MEYTIKLWDSELDLLLEMVNEKIDAIASGEATGDLDELGDIRNALTVQR